MCAPLGTMLTEQIAPVAQVLPALLMFLCFDPEKPARPTRFGYWAFGFLVVTMLCSLFARNFLDSDTYVINLPYGGDCLARMRVYVGGMLQVSATYVMLLLGFTAKQEPTD